MNPEGWTQVLMWEALDWQSPLSRPTAIPSNIFLDYNLITPFLLFLFSLQTLPYTPRHSSSNSWSPFSPAVIACRYVCVCTYIFLHITCSDFYHHSTLARNFKYFFFIKYIMPLKLQVGCSKRDHFSLEAGQRGLYLRTDVHFGVAFSGLLCLSVPGLSYL